VRHLACEVAEALTPASVRTLAAAASGPEGRVARHLPRASERMVCRTLDVNRNALRYRPRPGAPASEVRQRVIALSLSLPTQGHRKIVSHMRKLGYRVGLRKVRRIRRSAGLQLEPPKPGVRRRGRTTSLHQGEATRPDQVWSWDFVMLRTRKGRALRVLFIIDEFTKRIVARFMATAIKQEDVVRVLLEAMIREEARPENIRSDNGSEFIAETVQGFMAEQGIKSIYIDPGCPWQNGVIESFNSRFRKEFSDRWYFHNFDDIQVAMDDWLLDYNRYRPHGSLGLMTPDEFAGKPVDRRAHLLTLVAG
jgi:putative transposase